MKDIINVEVKAVKVDFVTHKTDLLCVGMFSDAKGLGKISGELNKKLNGTIELLKELGDFKGEKETSTLLYGDSKIGAKRLLLIGLGEKKKLTLDTIHTASAIAANRAVSLKAKTLTLALHLGVTGKLDIKKVSRALTEGVYFGSYQYDEYISQNKNGRLKKLKVEIGDSLSSAAKLMAGGVSVGSIIGRAQSFARTIANRPGNVIDPPALAALAGKIAKQTPGLTCTVFDEKQLKEKKMGGILAVGSGSKSEPRFIILKYTPRGKVSSKQGTIALVGKAITFDSGGISIKPSSGMQDMKLDKSGGIAVLATMKAVAELKLPVKVYGIIPSAENMPGGSSYRPGDIITTFSGRTVEVQNTDAEGRMVLCDGIHYAVTQNCDTIIDIATLTGSCKVALGKYKAGLMGNDDKLIKQLQAASQVSGEKIWHLPIGEEYLEEMKSKIADLKNVGSRWGGASTAAAFLGEFAGETKWAHIDMAGVDIFDGKKFGGVGASGFGVRLLTTYLMSLTNRK